MKTRLRSQLDATILEGLPKTPTRTRLTSGERQADSVYRLAYNLTTGFETDSTLKKIAGLQDNIDRIVDGDQEYVIQFKRDCVFVLGARWPVADAGRSGSDAV